MERLIETCQRSQRGFKAAAEAAQNEDLKRLLNLYSHQRTRFAAELKAHCQMGEISSPTVSETQGQRFSGQSDDQILDACLQHDATCLDAYAQVLASRVPGRAHFLISAQYSLLQQVHQRMRSMAARSGQTKVTSVSHCYET